MQAGEEAAGQHAVLELTATASLWHDPRLRLRDPEWNRRFIWSYRGDMPKGEQRWWADQRLRYLRMGLQKRQVFCEEVLVHARQGGEVWSDIRPRGVLARGARGRRWVTSWGVLMPG